MGKVVFEWDSYLWLYLIKSNVVFYVEVIESKDNYIITRDSGSNCERKLLMADFGEEWLLFADKHEAEKFIIDSSILKYDEIL